MASAPSAPRRNRVEEYLKKKELFRRNALLITSKMLELSSKIRSYLVDEVLHSIFFLGGINSPPYLPTDIFTDGNFLNMLKGTYPQPFEHYKSKLPRRSPLSCVMDMIVNTTGQQKEKEILSSLQAFIASLKEDQATELVSTTVCVSQPNKADSKSTRYYGMSMSTSGSLPGRIVVAAACLSNWEKYVAEAVMTYYPKMEKKSYFDGTIRLPGWVRCQAFGLSKLDNMLPCKSCANLFGFGECSTKTWPYGNCAEDESVSNLLKNEKEVKDHTVSSASSYTEDKREKAKESMVKELGNYLKMMKFSWDKTFYTPS